MTILGSRRRRREYKLDPLDRGLDDPTGEMPVVSEQPAVPADIAPDLPAGAVRNRQDVYAEGNRCSGCGVPSVGESCSRCALAEANTEQVPDLIPDWVNTVVPPLTDEATRRLLVAIFFCERCGARTDHDGLCVDYGRFHASADQLAAIASCERPQRSRGNR